MLIPFVVWLLVFMAVMSIGSKRLPTAGMPLAYFLGLSLIHTPGAAVYVDFPEWDTLAARTRIGFEQTVIGMVAFLGGVLIARFGGQSRRILPARWTADDLMRMDRLALIYLVGGICYFFMGSFISIPSLGAAIAALSSLIVVGSALRLWVAREQNNDLKLGLSLSLVPLLPLITIIRSGFIGFGIYWLLSIASFFYAQSKRRLIYVAISPLLIFIGLSFFVNYMASRSAYRESTWYRDTTLVARVEGAFGMFRNFEWYDSANSKHREVIDGRLNQNILVGAAAERLRMGTVDFANGATFVTMLLGLIPRAIWPNKPQVGGGGTVVTDFTGIAFAEGTSVGAGQVLEFYVNFGTLGVIGGFLIYGWLIGWMDLRTMQMLAEGNQKGVLLWFTVCLALLQPGGNLLEVTVSAAGSAITSHIFGHFVDRYWSRRRPIPATRRPTIGRTQSGNRTQ
jgi:hypothetical protein